MAKLRSVIGSGFVGRIGNVVGVRSKGGEYVIRARAQEVKNPNTLRQRTSRMRMTIASRLAAGLAAAIQAGYAFSTNGTKMHPRNMFVAEVVKLGGNGDLAVVGGTTELDYAKLLVSRRNGISEMVSPGTLDFDTAGHVTVPVSTPQIVDVLPEGNMGVVVVVYEPESNSCAVGFDSAVAGGTTNVDVEVPSTFSGCTVHVYAFLKFIPKSLNDVNLTAEPWKYPAQTGATTYCGTGNCA